MKATGSQHFQLKGHVPIKDRESQLTMPVAPCGLYKIPTAIAKATPITGTPKTTATIPATKLLT
jgi:hypothetical protein